MKKKYEKPVMNIKNLKQTSFVAHVVQKNICLNVMQEYVMKQHKRELCRDTNNGILDKGDKLISDDKLQTEHSHLVNRVCKKTYSAPYLEDFPIGFF